MAFTFTDTEQEQETTSVRRNTNSVLDNQLDFSSAVTYPSFTTPRVDTYQEEEESTPSYEVEKEYNIDRLPEDEIIVPTFMPKLHNSNPETATTSDYKIKLNARGKIIASVFGVVVGILIAFMIYNAVVISSLSNQLATLETQKATTGVGVTQLQSDYQDITSYKHLEMRANDLGLSYSPESSDVRISLQTRPEIETPETSSNWFDSLCEFFSNLFN